MRDEEKSKQELLGELLKLRQRVAEYEQNGHTTSVNTARLEELDWLKDEFMANISHELRTPLANIKLYVELLERGRPAKQAQYIKTLNSEVDRLQILVENLLNLARFNEDAVPIQLLPTDLNKLVAESVSLHAAAAVQQGVSLVSNTDPDLPPTLGDQQLISQSMSCLLTNAISYTPHGGAVTLQTSVVDTPEEDGWVSFSVKDTGHGVSAHDRPHIFERFYRGDVGRNSGVPGIGLGLAICREIIDRMHGRIEVESEPGQGATFTVLLKPA